MGSHAVKFPLRTQRLIPPPRCSRPHHILEGFEEVVQTHIQRRQDRCQRIHRNAALAAFQPTHIGTVHP